MDDSGFHCRVSPFRYLRINGYLLLPEAFRSLSRLSSALSAKASALRPFCLTISCAVRVKLCFRGARAFLVSHGALTSLSHHTSVYGDGLLMILI